MIASTGLAAGITEKNCIPTGFQWATNTYALAHGIGNAVVKAGGKTRFLLTADYVFSNNLAAAEFSSDLVAARTSRARVVGCECNRP